MLKDLFKNEVLHVLRKAATLKHLSDHMSALVVLRKKEYIILKCLSDESFFLSEGHVVENSLNSVCPLFMTADLDEVLLDHVQNLKSLLCRAV